MRDESRLRGRPGPSKGSRGKVPACLPDDQRKLLAVEQLTQGADEAGLSLIEPAHGKQVLQPDSRRRTS